MPPGVRPHLPVRSASSAAPSGPSGSKDRANPCSWERVSFLDRRQRGGGEAGQPWLHSLEPARPTDTASARLCLRPGTADLCTQSQTCRLQPTAPIHAVGREGLVQLQDLQGVRRQGPALEHHHLDSTAQHSTAQRSSMGNSIRPKSWVFCSYQLGGCASVGRRDVPRAAMGQA